MSLVLNQNQKSESETGLLPGRILHQQGICLDEEGEDNKHTVTLIYIYIYIQYKQTETETLNCMLLPQPAISLHNLNYQTFIDALAFG